MYFLPASHVSAVIRLPTHQSVPTNEVRRQTLIVGLLEHLISDFPGGAVNTVSPLIRLGGTPAFFLIQANLMSHRLARAATVAMVTLQRTDWCNHLVFHHFRCKTHLTYSRPPTSGGGTGGTGGTE